MSPQMILWLFSGGGGGVAKGEHAGMKKRKLDRLLSNKLKCLYLHHRQKCGAGKDTRRNTYNELGHFLFPFPTLRGPQNLPPQHTLVFSTSVSKGIRLLPQKKKKIYLSCTLSMMPQQGTCSNNYSLFLLTLLSPGVSCFWPVILMPSLLLVDHILFLSFKLLYSDSFSHYFFFNLLKFVFSLQHATETVLAKDLITESNILFSALVLSVVFVTFNTGNYMFPTSSPTSL